LLSLQNEVINNEIQSVRAATIESKQRSILRTYIEFAVARSIFSGLGLLPRSWALAAGTGLGTLARIVLPHLRRHARRNLQLAFPKLNDNARRQIERGVFCNLGRALAEATQFPKLNRQNIESIVVYEGLENYQRAVAQGRGVILLTGHIGAWELSVYAHSIYGYPMSFLARRVDNPLVERLAEENRARFGNRSIDKKGSLREVLKTLKAGGVVGILADLNSAREEGVFVDFFGLPACTTAGVATLALRTGAVVLPGYILWDDERKIHRLCFEPPIETISTGNQKEDIVKNTARYTQVLEKVIRRHPAQWLWIHRRWKTRPEGEKDLY
jgi:Kdo2-lipid IVA lauroyltransferase/acyltransferase